MTKTDIDADSVLQENDRLKSAIRRAYECLIDGRRVGDAMKVLKVAAPLEIREVVNTGQKKTK